jgi:hypothetical protein
LAFQQNFFLLSRNESVVARFASMKAVPIARFYSLRLKMSDFVHTGGLAAVAAALLPSVR